jgi:hypothetical protein
LKVVLLAVEVLVSEIPNGVECRLLEAMPASWMILESLLRRQLRQRVRQNALLYWRQIVL